ncbi:SAG family member [Eimeria tenella]|uniref:SAG family member n=1 Tax=Eimeria tenella TaxID=5802 RepID=U6KW76_EIMTE|nr:SAG family member [Eimeria tenella]CDJ40599.1 SAG family member [Eimeria tenella]|eukprot:XP_013231349.1 SAG family member [Eimeria tenella]
MLPRINALVSTSLLVLSNSISGSLQQGGTATIKYTASLGATVQCLNEINTAREAAGLPNFTKATDSNALPSPGEQELQQDSEWRKLCEHLIPTQEAIYQAATKAENPFKDGTYAFKSLTDAQPSCNDTVDYWKAAFKNFTGLPPSKSQANGLYDKQDNASFVALYNPSSNATADCKVVTCTKTTTDAGEEADEDTRAGQSSQSGHALICKTMPAAFADENAAPFTQQQWDAIVSSLTGSAAFAVPSLVGIALIAVAVTVV